MPEITFEELERRAREKEIPLQSALDSVFSWVMNQDEWQVTAHAEDIRAVQQILATNGLRISVSEVIQYREWVSRQMDSGWLMLGSVQNVLDDFAWFLSERSHSGADASLDYWEQRFVSGERP